MEGKIASKEPMKNLREVVLLGDSLPMGHTKPVRNFKQESQQKTPHFLVPYSHEVLTVPLMIFPEKDAFFLFSCSY